MIIITAEGIEKTIQRFSSAPRKLTELMRKGMEASLEVLHQSVPPYPSEPQGSSYSRTGTLGRSLGSGFEGGASGGKPTVYSITGSGQNVTGTFGTNLKYAKYVIDPDHQAYMHKGRWWTMRNIKDHAYKKVIEVWDNIVRGWSRTI